ncbi:MAG: FxsA family protein [Paracoccaceae bacterium]
MRLFLLFLAVPMIEIALFVQIGGAIGLRWTLATVLITAVIGTYMVRTQGALALGQLRQSMNEVSDPSQPLANGAMILFSGALLLTPGFFTDAVGFLLLIPGVRTALFSAIGARMKVSTFSSAAQQQRRDPGVIDGEWEEVESDAPRVSNPSGPPSGWTRH